MNLPGFSLLPPQAGESGARGAPGEGSAVPESPVAAPERGRDRLVPPGEGMFGMLLELLGLGSDAAPDTPIPPGACPAAEDEAPAAPWPAAMPDPAVLLGAAAPASAQPTPPAASVAPRGVGDPAPAVAPEAPAPAPAAPPAPPLAALSTQVLVPASPGASPSVPPDPVSVPPGHARWPEQVAAQVVWSVREKLTEAELRLHPPELGPVRVHLRLEQGEVGVQFAAAHPATREALEAALPRLRELFQEQGLALVQVQVGDREHASQPWRHGEATDAVPAELPATEPQVVTLRRLGLLDEYV